MRWLFLGLILINFFYFVWGQQEFFGSQIAISTNQGEVLSSAGRVRLLTEVPPSENKALAMQDSSERIQTLLLGGFVAEVNIKKLHQRLISLDIESNIVELSNSDGLEYRVYLEPLPTYALSKQALRELQVFNVESSIIASGELSGGIDFGVYKQKELAKDLVSDLRQAGYKALISVAPKNQREYWVDIDGDVQRLVDEELLEQLREDFPNLQRAQAIK